MSEKFLLENDVEKSCLLALYDCHKNNENKPINPKQIANKIGEHSEKLELALKSLKEKLLIDSPNDFEISISNEGINEIQKLLKIEEDKFFSKNDR